ncbi:hypothetical protein L249_6340 [Ophiocordyceps polyrhachis-furcata BCC 54312]|uniref:Uncharacterized protein n=1 Tax=Ophiocordyceps polyrhachis-furcata BCC 54312 TaxID=1330021 RepID=A0A367L190_9HYPO|nr:hypothetical protein L249_6340 [Ophiocordyceps polyrhachis-furcata BCC 54312]
MRTSPGMVCVYSRAVSACLGPWRLMVERPTWLEAGHSGGGAAVWSEGGLSGVRVLKGEAYGRSARPAPFPSRTSPRSTSRQASQRKEKGRFDDRKSVGEAAPRTYCRHRSALLERKVQTIRRSLPRTRLTLMRRANHLV